ncbi:MAG: class I SAM-dependent methyltransferase [Candidatus Omnitrophica bacterium]|nr:class I SAM-dependent methyltransferase [Candidatus Omnitrophota bacterium]
MTFDKIKPQDYENWYSSKEGLYFDKREKELIAKMIEFKPCQSLLEIGCGTGHFLKWFENFELNLTGIDSSRKMIEFGSGFLNKNTKLEVQDAESLSFEDSSFDIVVFITSLEFINNPQDALKESLRVAKEKVFVSFLNKLSLLSLKRGIKGLFKDSIYNQGTFYSVFQMKQMIKNVDKNLKIKTGGIKTKLGSGALFSPFVGILIEK